MFASWPLKQTLNYYKVHKSASPLHFAVHLDMLR